MNLIQRFAPNTAGRDFVAGDIHGCFDKLRQTLDALGFDSARDRLFAVGDLIDRGPDSLDALNWWRCSWFHACLGNHEEMLLQSGDPTVLMTWLFNGGDWWLYQSDATRAAFRSAVAQLPLAIEVETPHGRVGIVHADVPQDMSWPSFTAALLSEQPAARKVALWGRERAAGLIAAPVADIERVVCGHTVHEDRQVHVVGNVWLIDTGAFLDEPGSALTVMPLDAIFESVALG